IGEQDALLVELAARLDRDGVLLVREADASAGWRFMAVRIGNRCKQLVLGHWRQPFHPRTDAEWRACFARPRFQIAARPMGTAPFANTMSPPTVARDASASPPRLSPPA